MANLKKHEPDTTSMPIMSLSAVGLLAVLFGGVAGVGIGFKLLLPKVPIVSANDEATGQAMTPGVQPNQKFERQQLQAQERRVLTEFQWQNKEQNLARIPIEQAIQVMAKRKLQTSWPVSDTMTSTEPLAKEQP
jgi:hypothetical protein